MEKEFVTYELALKLKQIRFNEPCISFYSQGGKHNFDIQSPSTNIGSWSDQEHYCSSPLFQQAFRWFREKHRLKHIWIMDELLDTGEYTYEEAELACLKKLIEIVEQKNKKDETN